MHSKEGKPDPAFECLLDTVNPAFYVEVVSIRLRRTEAQWSATNIGGPLNLI